MGKTTVFLVNKNKIDKIFQQKARWIYKICTNKRLVFFIKRCQKILTFVV